VARRGARHATAGGRRRSRHCTPRCSAAQHVATCCSTLQHDATLPTAQHVATTLRGALPLSRSATLVRCHMRATDPCMAHAHTSRPGRSVWERTRTAPARAGPDRSTGHAPTSTGSGMCVSARVRARTALCTRAWEASAARCCVSVRIDWSCQWLYDSLPYNQHTRGVRVLGGTHAATRHPHNSVAKITCLTV
jgi:hypothetical protein